MFTVWRDTLKGDMFVKNALQYCRALLENLEQHTRIVNRKTWRAGREVVDRKAWRAGREARQAEGSQDLKLWNAVDDLFSVIFAEGKGY